MLVKSRILAYLQENIGAAAKSAAIACGISSNRLRHHPGGQRSLDPGGQAHI